MSRPSFSFPLLAAACLAAAPAAAQSNPVVGTWNLRYAAGTRVENGTPTVITGTGKLIVELEGDSLIARLIPDPIDGGPARPESRMAARSGTGPVVFVQRGVARVHLNGEVKDATSISTWTLDAKEDSLEGTVDRRLEGMEGPSSGPQPVTGTRVKG